MSAVEVVDATGKVRWTSPDITEPMLEIIDGVVRVTDLETGRVIATYRLGPGEQALLPP